MDNSSMQIEAATVRYVRLTAAAFARAGGGGRGRYRDHCQWDFLIGLSCFE
jgi:hypothetical protein